MTMMSALMMTITMTMAAAMSPRIYMAWLVAQQRCLDGEVEQLARQLEDENSWVWQQFICGAMSLSMIWMVRYSPHDLEIPASMEAALALYAGISMLFAVLESLIAQKISTYLRCVPTQIRVSKRN